jgi:hypothetical protein
VAEVCNLIYANLPENLQLLCEIQYSSFVNQTPLPKILQGRIRADLAVAEKRPRSGADAVPKFIIEVKRATSPPALMPANLQRLVAARRLGPDIRAFLFVISEAKRSKRFVDHEGHSLDGKHAIANCDGHYRVRRTWKAAHTFKKRGRA